MLSTLRATFSRPVVFSLVLVVLSPPLFCLIHPSLLRLLAVSRLRLATGTKTKLSVPRRRVWLASLPLEILTEILTYLPWRDILHLRQTCKIIGQTSKETAVWQSLVRKELECNPPTLRLDRPIEAHSSHELERLLLRMKTVEIAWKGNDSTRPRLRRVSLEDRPAALYLVKGGRWLLVATQFAAVFYYDLDCDDPEPIPLIPPKSKSYRCQLSVDIDEDSPYLKFNLALLSLASVGNEHLIHIWQVALAADPSSGLSLSAKLLTSFPQEPRGLTYSLSLLRSHISYTIRHNTLEETYVVVVDWRHLQSASVNYPKRLILLAVPQPYAYLLPGRKILLQSKDKISLFSFSSVDEDRTTLRRGHMLLSRSQPPALWEMKPGHTNPHVSPGVFHVGNACHIMVTVGQQVYDLTINKNSGDTVNSARLFKCPWNMAALIGYRRSLLWLEDEKLLLVTRRQRRDSGERTNGVLSSSVTTEGIGLDGDHGRGPFYDESSGRVVMYRSLDMRKLEFYVLDFARL